MANHQNEIEVNGIVVVPGAAKIQLTELQQSQLEILKCRVRQGITIKTAKRHRGKVLSLLEKYLTNIRKALKKKKVTIGSLWNIKRELKKLITLLQACGVLVTVIGNGAEERKDQEEIEPVSGSLKSRTERLAAIVLQVMDDITIHNKDLSTWAENLKLVEFIHASIPLCIVRAKEEKAVVPA